jgi:GNAT superfamily N-acetyltransferase
MVPELTFQEYQPADRDACLALFDANCPAFFAANERTDYLEFLFTAVGSYELCLSDRTLVGAYGLAPHRSGGLALRWILLAPLVQGRGLGSRIMARVLDRVRSSGASPLHIAASHKSAPFFARFGAQEVATIVNGWGPAMHRVDMVLAPEP